MATKWSLLGVRLVNGTEFRGKEIISFAGSYCTPQLLMLSDIGPAGTLSEYDIEQKVDVPEVGQGLADHLSFTTEWKLAKEYRMDTADSGNPLFSEAQDGIGQPNNFVASYGVSDISGRRLSRAMKVKYPSQIRTGCLKRRQHS